jgi:threonine dehydrogenase-like Zn-dependent dehydrogenase
MLAGKFTAPHRVELVETPEPELTPGGQGEIIFQPELTCLCGSDMPFFTANGEWPIELGHSLHEMIGRVVATNGQRWKVGDRVLCVPPNQLGLWERFRVSEDRCVAIDPRCSDEQAVLAQPLGTALFALKKLPNLLDLDVVVLGQGPMGQLFNMCVRAMGARQIIGIDKLESRLKTSRVTGTTATICNAQESPVPRVLELTGGKGPDIVIEAVGHGEQQFNLCIELVGYGGKILYFGVAPEFIDGLRFRDLMFKNGAVFTSMNPDFRREFPLAMQWIAERRVDVNPLVTHRYKLSEIQTAFETFRDRRDGALKVFIEFPAYRRSA